MKRIGEGPPRKHPKPLNAYPGYDLLYRQVATVLGHLPDVGFVEVLKTADGTNRTYTVPANESLATTNSSLANDSVQTFSVWEWEVTFVTKAGDLPLMAAVWSDGRTLPGEDEGFEVTGRAARLMCGSCQAFPSASWSSTAEASLGLRMEVKPSTALGVLDR